MSKNTELATALLYTKNRLKIELIDSMVNNTQQLGIEISKENWAILTSCIDTTVENVVNSSHSAFRSLTV
jgi:hypothetical protein